MAWEYSLIIKSIPNNGDVEDMYGNGDMGK